MRTMLLSLAILMYAAAGVLALNQQGTVQPNKGQSAAAQPDTSVITPLMVDVGRGIFRGKGMCAGCHGKRLQGSQIAPTLMPHAWRDAKDGEFAAIYYVDTHGVPSTLMVAHPGHITSEEALAVAAYVWSVSRGKAKP